MPNWDAIRQEWETSDISFKDLAIKHDIKDSTMRSRKNREGWQRNDATQRKNVATKKEIEEPVILSDDLTDKQRLFCIYYIKYFNATKAYQKAYGCDYITAMSAGSRMLRNVKVISEIERLKEERTSELMLSVDDVLQKYIDITFADITDYVEFGRKDVIVGFDGEGDDKVPITQTVSFVDLHESEEVDGTIITEVKQGRDGVSVRLADKMKALEMLTKYFDILPDTTKRRLEEEKLKLELAQMTGDSENDAHEQGSSYEDALNAQVEDVFADETT